MLSAPLEDAALGKRDVSKKYESDHLTDRQVGLARRARACVSTPAVTCGFLCHTGLSHPVPVIGQTRCQRASKKQ
ncbi:hypothetical protein Pta02_21970 [Planobispora takensis]|uniref:Uncharacterized protein n=1 Tax=Planobispora takensis TaxID=1367882 RepID=A0A8J3WS10_9ACTN|nr:hypothetical protein Pta02_21970 [Planobispora takensis]